MTTALIPETRAEGMRLGRHINHDPRSLAYKYPADGTAATARWERSIPILDQGQSSACTGNALVGVLGTAPFYPTLAPKLAAGLTLDEGEAKTIYSAAEVLDGGAGLPAEDQGSSGLSVAKVAKSLGLISGYQHITSVAAAQSAIQATPFLVGTNWLSGMDTPDSGGLVRATGSLRGGHEYECVGYDTATDLWEFCNSWGTGWGAQGRFFYSSGTFAQLLAASGDATVLTPLTQPAPAPASGVTKTFTPGGVAALDRWSRSVVSRLTLSGKASAAWKAAL